MELTLGKLTHLVWVRTFALLVRVRTFTCMVRELTLNKLNKFTALDEVSTLHRWILVFRVRVWKFSSWFNPQHYNPTEHCTRQI